MDSKKTITELLESWRSGSKEAGDEVFEDVYTRLRQTAGALMAAERRDHTLQPTELVADMVVRISKSETLTFPNRYEFFACAAKIMRHVLVDHARRKAAMKHGGDLKRVSLTELEDQPDPVSLASTDLPVLDLSLARLERVRPEAAKIFEFKYFVGLSQQELVQATGMPLATVKRRLKFAKAWIAADIGVGGRTE